MAHGEAQVVCLRAESRSLLKGLSSYYCTMQSASTQIWKATNHTQSVLRSILEGRLIRVQLVLVKGSVIPFTTISKLSDFGGVVLLKITCTERETERQSMFVYCVMLVEVIEKLMGVTLVSFLHVGPRDQTQV